MLGQKAVSGEATWLAAVIASRAWSSLDWLNRRPEWDWDTGDAGSLRRHLGALERRGSNTAPPGTPDTCPARVAKG